MFSPHVYFLNEGVYYQCYVVDQTLFKVACYFNWQSFCKICDIIIYCEAHDPFLQLEIPKLLFDQNIFNAWMVLFLNVLERPVPSEGQPVDPELRKSWGWWKVKKWTVHILNRLYTRYGRDVVD